MNARASEAMKKNSTKLEHLIQISIYIAAIYLICAGALELCCLKNLVSHTIIFWVRYCSNFLALFIAVCVIWRGIREFKK